MEDRAMFLQDEINCAYMDDWTVLPNEWLSANVHRELLPAIERHELAFYLTH
jgi:hypothetical protein